MSAVLVSVVFGAIAGFTSWYLYDAVPLLVRLWWRR